MPAPEARRRLWPAIQTNKPYPTAGWPAGAMPMPHPRSRARVHSPVRVTTALCRWTLRSVRTRPWWSRSPAAVSPAISHALARWLSEGALGSCQRRGVFPSFFSGVDAQHGTQRQLGEGRCDCAGVHDPIYPPPCPSPPPPPLPPRRPPRPPAPPSLFSGRR